MYRTAQDKMMHLVSLIGWVTLPSATTSENHCSGQKSIKSLTEMLVCVSQCLDTVSVVSLGRGVSRSIQDARAALRRRKDREAVLVTGLLCPATEGAAVQC